jgi:hypothetical protein
MTSQNNCWTTNFVKKRNKSETIVKRKKQNMNNMRNKTATAAEKRVKQKKQNVNNMRKNMRNKTATAAEIRAKNKKQKSENNEFENALNYFENTSIQKKAFKNKPVVQQVLILMGKDLTEVVKTQNVPQIFLLNLSAFVKKFTGLLSKLPRKPSVLFALRILKKMNILLLKVAKLSIILGGEVAKQSIILGGEAAVQVAKQSIILGGSLLLNLCRWLIVSLIPSNEPISLGASAGAAPQLVNSSTNTILRRLNTNGRMVLSSGKTPPFGLFSPFTKTEAIAHSGPKPIVGPVTRSKSTYMKRILSHLT